MSKFPYRYVLEKGENGQVVKDLQKLLNISDDGQFGPATEKAVRGYQAANELQVDGKAGPQTLGLLGIAPKPFIDVSHHQGKIDWANVPKDLAFVVLKCSEGATFKDKRYQENLLAARAAGFDVRAYHYAKPGNNAAEVEARFACETAAGAPVYLDLEESGNLSSASLTAWALKFMNTVQAIQGRLPVLYTGSAFLRYKLNGGSLLSTYPLWLARYSGEDDDPGYIGAFSKWWAWQLSSKGKVPGIDGDVDINWLYTPPPCS
jgi:GH25 family lysozyme M1 (1,4-beta-N-acetylmuramidase)